ncbi:uncharacterized protein Lolal isoform X1 [Temnothorax nylanderi]|uniref:uncharacterized protein Lolal isoform X1 n=1 Tax=Temnothorax nylanderi TaxID=102681 RepID=UPI003A84225F
MEHACFSQLRKKRKIILNNNSEKSVENDKARKNSEAESFPENQHLKTITKVNKRTEVFTLAAAKEISESQQSIIRAKIISKLPNSAFTKHIFGRHNPINVQRNESKITDAEKEAIKTIFQLQESELMETIKNFNVNSLKNCCQDTIIKLSKYLQQICENTKLWYAYWHEERQYRITGSICYNLYTYTKNTKANWKKKCNDTFTPKNFKSEYTEYGKKTEGEARDAFKKKTSKEVIETGLVVSQQNPWLAYSPDGVIFKDGRPTELLEIKCPFKGKTMTIEDTVNNEVGKSLIKDKENIYLKEKHRYYGQVQLGMAVLNLKSTLFVIYSTFDKNLFILRVNRNEIFLTTMLKELKKYTMALCCMKSV